MSDLTEGSITCSKCGALNVPQPLPEGELSRRVTLFRSCGNCLSTLKLQTYEGWERWYVMGHAPNWPPIWEEYVKGPESDAFYERAKNVDHGVKKWP